MPTAMAEMDPNEYGPKIAALLVPERELPLDAGSPNLAMRNSLRALTEATASDTASASQALFPGRAIVDFDSARACVAGLWLYHGYLDESHTLSQRIESPTGSFWHGVMHRREGDYSNAKYWFRLAGRHPVLAVLGQRATEYLSNSPAASVAGLADLVRDGDWQPAAFVDHCSAAVRRPGTIEPILRGLQLCEWQTLFEDSFRHCFGILAHGFDS